MPIEIFEEVEKANDFAADLLKDKFEPKEEIPRWVLDLMNSSSSSDPKNELVNQSTEESVL